MDFDTAVKLNIYETIARTTQAPTSADVAKALFTSPEEVEAAIARLHKKRLLVQEPGNSSPASMCHPFRGAGGPVVGGHPVHLSDHAALPVGRDPDAVV